MFSRDLTKQAQDTIGDLFLEHVSKGKQSEALETGDALACGQFIGKSAESLQQRGLHGVAAAIRVLADTPGGEETAKKLVNYVEIHCTQRQQEAETDTSVLEQANVIKISEILYACSCLKPNLAPKDYITTIADRLITNFEGNKKEGWGYFTSKTGEIDPLPSAFAILALCKAGYQRKISEAITILKNKALAPPDTSEIKEGSVRIFCLFVLAFHVDDIDKDLRSKLESAVKNEWQIHKSLLGSHVEQNIEYWSGSHNYYVRVPWQLYLLTLCAKISPRFFYSKQSLELLNSALKSVQSKGFIYPYSGAMLSSRTNAILFDSLARLRQCQPSMAGLINRCHYYLSQLRSILSKPAFRYTTITLFTISAVYCIGIAFTSTKSIADLGPGFVTSWAMFITTSIINSFRGKT